MLLNKHNLAIYELADEYASRWRMNGVYISPEETVATDGRALIAVTLPDAPGADRSQFPVPHILNGAKLPDTFEPFVLPTKTAKEILRNLPVKTTVPITQYAAVVGVEMKAERDGDEPRPWTATLATNDLETPRIYTPHLEAGQFPDYKRIVPKYETYDVSVCFDPGLLGLLMAQFQRFLKDDTGSGVRTYFERTGLKGLLMEAYNRTTRQTMRAMVMPMRDETAHDFNRAKRDAQRAGIERRIQEGVSAGLRARLGKKNAPAPAPVALDITPEPDALEKMADMPKRSAKIPPSRPVKISDQARGKSVKGSVKK